jgi:hypothetical protein
MEHIDIPSLFASLAPKSAERVAFDVSFDYGHYDAVNKNLVNKTGAISEENRAKYPLIWLVTPFEQRFNPKGDSYCELSGLDILVLTKTDPDASLDAKIAANFQPVLWPIVRALFVEIADSGLFQVLSDDAIPYDYMKDWFYQSGLSGKNNLFNDTLDAVQIRNMRLKVNEKKTDRNRILNN